MPASVLRPVFVVEEAGDEVVRVPILVTVLEGEDLEDDV